MNSIDFIYETLNIDLVNSTLVTTTEMISFLTTVYALYEIIIKSFNSLPKHQRKLFKKSQIKPWKIKLFLIRISLDKIPKITRWDRFLALISVCLIITGISISGRYYYKLSTIPPNWAALTLISSKENFLITYGKAASFDEKKSWSLDDRKCLEKSYNILSIENNTSENLAELICKMIGNKVNYFNIETLIKETKNHKKTIYILLTIINFQMLFLLITASMTLLYKKRLRNIILEEQKRAVEVSN